MKRNYKKIRILLGFTVVSVVVISLSWRQYSPNLAMSNIVTTPVQDKYIQAFTDYLSQRQQEGLITAKEIRVQESEPFIYILKPSRSQEITAEDLQNTEELILRAVGVFESKGGLRHDDIDIPFQRPAEQKIVLIKQRNMPQLLSADVYGEMTMSVDGSYFTSLVNLAGPAKNKRQDYGNSWATVQAICLAYAGGFTDSDPVCNIISANAAAAWVGMDQDEAVEIINSYGMTHLQYLGSKDYQYRFIEFVYKEFIH